MRKIIITHALAHALLTVAYIVLVVTLMSSAENMFGDQEETILLPMIMLSVFVLSAAITGFLVFGKPIMWYIDGKKKEALSLLGHTLAFLFGLIVIGMVILYFCPVARL